MVRSIEACQQKTLFRKENIMIETLRGVALVNLLLHPIYSVISHVGGIIMLPFSLSGHRDNLRDLIAGSNLHVTLANGKQGSADQLRQCGHYASPQVRPEAIERFAPWYVSGTGAAESNRRSPPGFMKKPVGWSEDFVDSDRDRNVESLSRIPLKLSISWPTAWLRIPVIET